LAVLALLEALMPHLLLLLLQLQDRLEVGVDYSGLWLLCHVVSFVG